MKDRVGRVRYVAFAVDGGPARGAIESRLRRLAAEAWGEEGAKEAGVRLTAYEAGRGLVRVKHRHARALRDRLAEAGLRPLGTSGTARRAKARWMPARSGRPSKGSP